MSNAREARRHLHAAEFGMLATRSRRFPGYPFGSIVPFVLDHAARPAFFISRLAEHRKNIDADGRVSLLAHAPAEHLLAGARLTLVGDAEQAGDDGALRERYLRYVPGAAQLLELGDFDIYRIAPVAVRFIAGFGAVHWLSAADFAPGASLEAIEADVLAHMNADHRRALEDCCRQLHGVAAQRVEMIGIDCDGFDVRADGRRLRFPFESEVKDAAQARDALARMARASR